MNCPQCNIDMTHDPVRYMQYCNEPGCDYPFVVTGIAAGSYGKDALRDGHGLKTQFKVYGNGRGEDWEDQMKARKAAEKMWEALQPKGPSVLAQLLAELEAQEGQ